MALEVRWVRVRVRVRVKAAQAAKPNSSGSVKLFSVSDIPSFKKYPSRTYILAVYGKVLQRRTLNF